MKFKKEKLLNWKFRVSFLQRRISEGLHNLKSWENSSKNSVKNDIDGSIY
jgi:hypothetical protein